MCGRNERAICSSGVTLPELLVVVAIISLAVMVSIPLVSDVVREARLKGAVGEFAAVLRAARWTAVNSQATTSVTVTQHPNSSFEWTNLRGVVHDTAMPDTVCVESVVDGANQPITAIRFHANGGTDGATAVTVVLEDPRNGSCTVNLVEPNGWIVRTNLLGFTKVTRVE
ncbi:MAG: prepilin-type N-terminal cleavage/methylation domain-containing protein [Acidobacteriota bacterium]|nr:prepilin-type N-terminal cleavage/methylation domain-containing protein [Acidobacteriota bacterium]